MACRASDDLRAKAVKFFVQTAERLALAAETLGFLSAVIEGQKKPRSAAFSDDQRLELFSDFNDGEYIWHIFKASGAVADNGFGPSPLPFSEIAAIQMIYRLNEYEATTIRQMSVAYHAGLVAGENPFSIEPWSDQDD